jgi:hypothetical protein
MSDVHQICSLGPSVPFCFFYMAVRIGPCFSLVPVKASHLGCPFSPAGLAQVLFL